MKFLKCNLGSTRSNQIIFQKNLYYSTQGLTAIDFDNTLYTDFETWQAANPDQENFQGVSTYLNTNPHFSSVGNTYQLEDPKLLSSLTDYIPQANSPCLDHGLHLLSLFGINPGHFDFWKHLLSYSGSFSIGASY